MKTIQDAEKDKQKKKRTSEAERERTGRAQVGGVAPTPPLNDLYAKNSTFFDQFERFLHLAPCEMRCGMDRCVLRAKNMGRRGDESSQAQLKGTVCGKTTFMDKCLGMWLSSGFLDNVMRMLAAETQENGAKIAGTDMERDDTSAVEPATVDGEEARAAKARQNDAQDELLSREVDFKRMSGLLTELTKRQEDDRLFMVSLVSQMKAMTENVTSAKMAIDKGTQFVSIELPSLHKRAGVELA